MACRIDSHGQHPGAKRLLRIHLFSQRLATTRDSHVTLTLTSPRRLLRPLSAFTISIEQYSTYSKGLLTFHIHFPHARRWLRKSPGQTLKRRAIPQKGRSAPTFHSSTKIPSPQLSTPTSFQVIAECSAFDLLFTIVDFVCP